MSEVRKLSAGQQYDVDSLELAYWVDSHYRQTEAVGYHVANYFEDGMFLGADDDGIQPVFYRKSIVLA